MCGIFGVINDSSQKAAQTILEGLKKLEYRGYDSWGIAIIPTNSDKVEIEKHVGKISTAQTTLPQGSTALGHTRWATHGGVTDKNAHPHLDCTEKIAVIHNGIVENYQELKEELIAKEHHFISETDSEVIAHLIEEKRKTTDIVRATFEVFNSLVGSNAVAVLDLESNTITACRDGSPLVVGIDTDQYFIASDVTAFLQYTQEVYFVNDGEGFVLSTNGVELFDLKSLTKKALQTQHLDWNVEDAEKNGYPHFLLKEIMEQKTTIPKTARLNQTEIKKIADMIKNQHYNVVMSGCGTASFCGVAAKYFFAKQGISTEVYGAYEFIPFAHFCNEKTIFIAISQSGETADTLIAAKAAKAKGSHIVAVVNARGSTLERMADTVLPVGVGPEIAVVSTKAYTSQLAILYQLAFASADKYELAQKNIHKLSTELELWLNNNLLKTIIKVAKELINQEDIYIIGKYLQYAAALEFSLKIKETSYIHSEAFASGELKHGVITLIQKDTPCIVLVSNDDTKHEVFSSAAQLKARGGSIIGISPVQSKECDSIVLTPDIGELTIFPNIIVGQLLGYYLGIGRGADPDKPRNLAKSVTVK